MSNTWIKICGITRHSDALAAQRLGADAIGLVFYKPSPRAIRANQIAAIVEGLGSVEVVALFVDPTVEEVEQVISSGAIDILQFHGDESPEFCQSFGLRAMKAFRVGAQEDLKRTMARYADCEFILLDAYDSKAPGGTGKVFDWDLAVEAAQCDDVKLVLAGGLSPHNVGEAIAKVNPFGVDVSSGVEASPGIKDGGLVKEFIEGVRSGSS